MVFLLWFFFSRLKKIFSGAFSVFDPSTFRSEYSRFTFLVSLEIFVLFQNVVNISGELKLLQISRSSSSSRALICDPLVFVNLALFLLNEIVVALISIFIISQSRRLSSKSE